MMAVAGLVSCRTAGPASAPPRVDLTANAWFPPVRAQQGNSCAQQSGLYYLLAAAEGRASGRRVELSPYPAYTALAGNLTGNTHLVDGWILARETGAPPLADAPRAGRGLMHGFDKYVRAASLRPEEWSFLRLRETADLPAVKRLIASGRPVACDFQMRGTILAKAADGRPLVKKWGDSGPGHTMVYAGYDDSIGFDGNGDGRITNDLDITGDGRVTLADQERGAFLLVNPWGPRWGAGGMAWAPYRGHALSRWPRSGEVAVVEKVSRETPRLMLKMRLRLEERRDVIVTAGAADRGDAAPGRVWSPLPFRQEAVPYPAGRSVSSWEIFSPLHRAGPHISAGPLAAPDGGPLEIGLDISALGKADRYFLDLHSGRGGNLRGELVSASFVRFDGDGRLREEIPVPGLPARIEGAGGRWSAAR